MALNGKNNLNSYDTKNYDRFLGDKKKASTLDTRFVTDSFDHHAIETPNDQFVINACMMGNLNLIEEFLDSGHGINEFLITGWTLLLYASSYAQPNVIQYLLSLGGDPNLHQEGYTALMALCYSTKGSEEKRLKCLKYLIEGKANVNAANKLKETPLMFACKMQEIDFILELLKYVVHINFADSEQRTALFYAVADNRYDVAKLLIEKGADITWTNYHGLNSYDVAVIKGHDKFFSLLNSNYEENKQDKIETNCVSSWTDMFPTINQMNMDSIDNDVANILYGMGLESYKAYFQGVDLKTFLRLKEEDLEKIGIDISVHRKKFIDELFRFHKQEWSSNLMNIDKSQPFTTFEAIKILGNINKQLSVMSSSVYFSKNYLSSIEKNEELNISNQDKERLETEIRNIQITALRIKEATSRIESLTKTINDLHSDLSLPTYIENKNRKSSRKWIVITVITIAGIYFLKMKSIQRLWNNENASSKSWRNISNFSLSNILYDKLYRISLLLQKGY